MTIDSENLLNSILESLERLEHIKVEDIPNIDLYMDQVTTFMDRRLRKTTRDPGEDKILTKTMINNYAKNNLLPPPVKKKYSREHILLLIFIYYFKGVLSINDIQDLLNPISKDFFDGNKEFSLMDIYDEVFGLEKESIDSIKKDITEKFMSAQETFGDAPDESKEFLQQFSFICTLSFDVYVKKLLIEKMIDGIRPKSAEAGKNSGDVKKEAIKKEAIKKEAIKKES